MAKNEFLVIACDGVWDVMTCEQVTAYVANRIRQSGTMGISPALGLSQVASDLVNKALSLGSTDNVTVVIVLKK